MMAATRRHARLRTIAAPALLVLIAGALFAAPGPPARRAATPAAGAAVTPLRTRSTSPLSPIVSTSDTFLVTGFGFEDAHGVCEPRGWDGEDRTEIVYAHVSGAEVVNLDAFAGRHAATGLENVTGLVATTPLAFPRAVAQGDSGNIVFSDQAFGQRLLCAYPASGIMRVYGTFPIVGGDPVAAGAATDPLTHSIFATDAGQGRIVQFFGIGGGGPGTVVAGGGTSPLDTTVAFADIGNPVGITMGPASEVYFADPTTHRVRRISSGHVTTLVGTGVQGSGGSGLATTVPLNSPEGVALDPAHNRLYVGDTGNDRVLEVDLVSGNLLTSIAVPHPRALAFQPGAGGTGLLSVESDPQIVTISLPALSQSVVAGGDGFGPPAGASSALRQALTSPGGLVPDGAGGLYFADGGIDLVLHMLASGQIQTVAGVPLAMHMGNQSLWVGVEPSSAPDELAGWVGTQGYGNDWSQRLVSPAFSITGHPGAVLTFDAGLDFGHLFPAGELAVIQAFGGEWMAVQAQKPDGSWTTLKVRLEGTNVPHFALRTFAGRGLVRVTAALDQDGNASLGLAGTTRLRIVLQTSDTQSNEDGLAPAGRGAAQIDNLALTDGGLPVFTAESFESGPGALWHASAQNGVPFDYGCFGPQAAARPAAAVNPCEPYTRDLPNDMVTVALRSGLDAQDPTCAWYFLANLDTVPSGVQARLVSPWIALEPGDSTFHIKFSGKLNTLDEGRFLRVFVRGKNGGDTHPLFIAQPLQLLTSETEGGDETSPYVADRVLTYPDDFESPLAAESIQVVFQVEDRGESVAPLFQLGGRPRTILPYIDNVRLYQLGVDQDHDGVADAQDACPTECAAGQDGDANGCIDPDATLHHVESWSRDDLPLHYAISQGADPANPNPEDASEIAAGFQAWVDAPDCSLKVVRDPDTPQVDASMLDGVNLVTFQDPDFQFPPGVLAITPTTSFIRRSLYHDRIVLPGQIVDADMIFNPEAHFSTPHFVPSGVISYDLRSVTTHEAGHFFGLSHSGVLHATMFFVIQDGTGAASLDKDDIAAIGAAYPKPSYDATHGRILGRITRGSNGQPIPGALVTAVTLSDGGAPVDSAATDYTDENGNYRLLGLAPGTYGVRVTPLDGEVGGFPLTPDYISERVADGAQTNFTAEWRSPAESATDDPDIIEAISVGAGGTTTGKDIITNIDTTPPFVVGSFPANGATGVRVDATLLANFSERISSATLQGHVQLHRTGGSGTVGASARIVNGGRTIIFTPTDPLAIGTSYDFVFTSGITDLQGVPLNPEFTATFQTITTNALAVSDVEPRAAAQGAYITVLGGGFDPAVLDTVIFDGCSDCSSPLVVATNVTPTSMVVQVPPGAATGNLRVQVHGVISNTVPFRVLPFSPQVSPSPVADIPLPFAPTDVALAPAGDRAYAVGAGGLALVDLATRIVTPADIGASSHAALTPDGKRLIVTQPGLGQVLDINLDPNDGALGAIKATIPTGAPGVPDGATISPSGRRAFVTDQLTGTIYEIDTDASSGTRDQVVDELSLPGQVLTAGVAVMPTNDLLLYTTGNDGSRLLRLGTDVADAIHPGASEGGVAVRPMADEILYAGAGAFGGDLLSVRISLGDPGATAQIGLGGSPRDLVVAPPGQSALVVNSTTSQIQVVGTDAGDAATYHAVVGAVGTGAGPVAIAQSLDGGLLATANFGARSIGIYRTGGSLGLVRSVAPVGRPGDAVAVQPSSNLFGAGSQLDLGAGPFAPSYRLPGGGGAAFAVPAGSQRDAGLAAIDPAGSRTLALPFRVVDPLTALAPASTGVQLPLASLGCFGNTVGQFDAMRLSPDGSLLALVRNPVVCPGVVELYAADDARAKDFGQPLTRAAVIPTDLVVHDAAFASDGRRVWVTDLLDVFVVNSDRSSPGFGSLVATISGAPGGGPAGIAADPLNRYMMVGSTATGNLDLYTPAGALVSAVALTAPGEAVAASPDGRTAVVAGGGRAMFVNLETPGLITASAIHGSTALHLQRFGVAIPANGKRAVVRFSTGIGVYNLDPGAGAIGTELYFGNPFAGVLLPGPLVPGPRGDDVLAGSATTNDLLRIDPSVLPPVVTIAPLGVHGDRLAPSPDGRLLWVGRTPSTTSGDVSLFGLGRATGLTLVSGGGQSGLAGQTLPLPVRVRATGAAGIPEAGVAVRFGLPTGQGTLDQDSANVVHLTDANGEAGVTWTLPAVTGTQSLVITALGVPGGTLTVNADVVANDSQIIPQVVEFGPPNGTSNFNVGTPVYIRFNQKMQSASIMAKMKLFANAGPVTGQFDLQDEGRFVIFRPDQPLAFAARCSLSVEAGALDTDNQALVASGFSVFHVESAPPLAVTALTPPAAGLGAPIVLDGTGFSPSPGSNTVLFNGVPTTVTAASPTSISVPVPQGAVTGPVTVQVGTAVSPPVNFTVLSRGAPISDTQGDLPAGPTATKVVITADGKRCFVSNPAASSVTALDLVTLQQIGVVTVGLDPSGIDLLPDDTRAYVCNQGSDDVSVIDIVPGSATYLKVIKTIPVGHQPRDLAVSGFGPEVLVVNYGSQTLSVIDANAGNATFDQVTTSTNLGSGGNAIGVTPDGGRAYIVTSSGTIVKFDLMTGAVTTSTNLGSGGNAIGITPDGTIALVLLQNGDLVAVNIVPGSTKENQVVASTNTGSGGGGGGGGIAISPDGGTAYVTDTAGNTVFVYQIVNSSGGPVSFTPGPAIQLVKVDSIPVGQAPLGLAIDPTRGAFGLVCNSGAGTITILGHLGTLPPIPVDFAFNPGSLNLKSLGHWVKGQITVPAPYTPADVVVPSLRINGVVGVDPAAPIDIIGNTLTVRFPRTQVELVLTEGDAVPVYLTGKIGTRDLTGSDVIKVHRGQVLRPAAHDVLQSGHPYTLTWNTPQGTNVQWVAVLHSYDRGANWTLDATHLPNTGDYRWWTPWTNSDSVKVAVAWVESGDTTGTAVEGVLGVSGYFAITGATDVEAAPTELTFSPLAPNPAPGRILMRFGLPRATDVRLEIYDLLGRRVRTLVAGEQPAGWHDVEWTGRTEGGTAGAGIYFVRFKAEGREIKRRLVWLH